jgi:hypothetical protein
MTPRDGALRRWRASWAYRVAFALFVLFMQMISVLSPATRAVIGTRPETDSFSPSWQSVSSPTRGDPRDEQHPKHLHARSVITSRAFALEDLASVRPGYYGLTLIDRRGRRSTVPLLREKWNIASWLGRETKADSLTAAILAARGEPTKATS